MTRYQLVPRERGAELALGLLTPAELESRL